MDKFVEAEILATCNALGIVIRGVYEKGSDCLNCLKDLLRYLRKDDDTHNVLRFLGHTNVLENDLLPLLKRYENDKEIFDFTLRLIVALTSPALLLFKEEIPEDKISNNIYLQLVNYLQSYKRAFWDVDVWNALYRQLAKLLEMRRVERSEDDGLILERILIVIRNILHVPTHELTSIQTDDDMSPQDKILKNIRLAKIDVLFLYLCANEDEYSYCLHMIEMVSLMLREHSPETLASTNEHRTGEEKEKDMDALMMVRQREQNMKLKKVQSMVSARFNGVYRVKNMKSLSNNDYISHKFVSNFDDVKFDENKTAKRIPKNRVPLKDINSTRRSTLSIRLFLKKFCKEFLNSYNKLMAGVKRELHRKSSAEHDDTYYLWAIEYFMKFNRLSDFQPALVSETISMQMFHHIQTQITTYHEMMQSDKKKSSLWSKRMRLGVSAYKELLQTVFTMTKSKDSVIQQNADIIVSNVFYVIEYREMLISLLSNFDEVKFSLTYLSELIESTYMFLKMLENHSKQHSEIIIQKRKKKVRRRKKKKPIADHQPPASVDLEEEWTELASNLSAAVQGRRNIPADSLPFDGASEISFEEQKVDAMFKIRHALVSKQAEQAVSLLRSARELWPDGDSFGTPNIDSEDEFMVLREIYLSNLENPHPESNPPAPEEDEYREETDEEMEEMPVMIEQQLDLNDMYKRYASPKIVQPCCLLLANYQNNSSQTNVSLIKLLHRIAWDCKMHALFFQSSVFLTFQKIFQDPDVSTNPVTKELYRFAKFILTKFFDVAQKNEKVFVEMLFWKGVREAYELEEGYGTSDSLMKGAWTEKEEDELRELYEENKDIYIEGQDVADIICASIENRRRNKHQIILALKRLGLIQSAKDLKPHLRKDWKEDEVIELQNLFEDNKESDDLMGSILNGLSIKRSRKTVIEKMLELNMIQDRKEVLKKRSKKGKKADGNTSDADSFIENSEGEDQVVPYSGKRNPGEESSADENEEEKFFQHLKAQRLQNQNAVSQVDSYDIYGGLELQNEASGSKNSDSKKTSKNKNDKPSKRSKNSPEVWEEQEIMELNTIFNNNRDSADIMGMILSSLTVKKSRQSIIEKLLEVGLIKDKSEVRKKRTTKPDKNNLLDVSNFIVNGLEDNESSENGSSSNSNDIKKKVKRARQILSDSEDEELLNDAAINNSDSGSSKNKMKKTVSKYLDSEKVRKRLPKNWEEREIIELQQLFEKHRGAPDIMGSILSELSVRRPKETVIEKLLEVKLIEDRKDIRKKRQKQDKTLKQSKNNNLDSIIEGIEDDAEDSEKDYSTKSNKKKARQILSDSEEEDVLDDAEVNNGDSGVSKNKIKKIVSKSLDGEKVRKRPPKEWEEKEIIELQQLFEKHRGASDIIGSIFGELSIKRPKGSITEKLLEVKLIGDRKEIRKKRLKQDKTPKQSKNDKLDSVMNDGSSSKNKNHISTEKKKTKHAILSDSSEDETLPLSKMLKNGTNTSEGRTKKFADISSDDDYPLSNFRNNKENGFVNNSAGSGVASTSLVRDSSENDALFNELIKSKIGSSASNKSVNSQKEKALKKISDSSDEETLSIKKIVTETNISSNDPLADTTNYAEGPTERSELPLFMTDSRKEDSFSSVSQKRKRLFIDDSDESEDDVRTSEDIVKKPSQLVSDIKDTVETVPVNRSKKRARVLLDSDESD